MPAHANMHMHALMDAHRSTARLGPYWDKGGWAIGGGGQHSLRELVDWQPKNQFNSCLQYARVK